MDTSALSQVIKKGESARSEYEKVRDDIQTLIENSGYSTLTKEVNKVQYWVYMSNVLGSRYQDYKEAQAELRQAKENLAYAIKNTKKWRTEKSRLEVTIQVGRSIYC